MKSPAIVFLIFNRPSETAQTFEAIRTARPSELFVVADGPRSYRPSDLDLCERTRGIIDQVDWPCQVRRNFSDENMGCGKRVSSGLDWAFAQVEGAIILEDDCLPDLSFFPYCAELLERYRDDERVINGFRQQFPEWAAAYIRQLLFFAASPYLGLGYMASSMAAL